MRKHPTLMLAAPSPQRCHGYLGRLTAAERRAGLGREGTDAGFTLVEMSVAMLIMTILTCLIMTGMIHLVTPTLQTEAIRDSSDQLNTAFLQLDSQVRYATQIWTPYAGTPATNDTWDLLFASTFNGASSATCTELQYNWNLGKLSEATWTQGATTTPGYKMLVNGLSGSSDPFSPVDATSSVYTQQQLQITLTASSGGGSAKESTTSQVTFTALNSTTFAFSSATSGGCYATWAQT